MARAGKWWHGCIGGKDAEEKVLSTAGRPLSPANHQLFPRMGRAADKAARAEFEPVLKVRASASPPRPAPRRSARERHRRAWLREPWPRRRQRRPSPAGPSAGSRPPSAGCSPRPARPPSGEFRPPRGLADRPEQHADDHERDARQEQPDQPEPLPLRHRLTACEGEVPDAGPNVHQRADGDIDQRRARPESRVAEHSHRGISLRANSRAGRHWPAIEKWLCTSDAVVPRSRVRTERHLRAKCGQRRSHFYRPGTAGGRPYRSSRSASSQNLTPSPDGEPAASHLA